MKRQHGQTSVEFALIFPLIALFIFGMIYGGYMFMNYLDFSNDARQVARRISVIDNRDSRKNIIKEYDAQKESYSLYTITRNIYFEDKDENKIIYADLNDTSNNLIYEGKETPEGTDVDPVDVVVEVNFVRSDDVPPILTKEGFWGIDFPPKYLKPIKYRMRLEKNSSVSED